LTDLEKLPTAFYATPRGNEPVREWLLGLNDEDRKTIGDDIQTAEFGWPVGMPLSRSLDQSLWEIRSSISAKRIARVIFVVHKERMVLLHGFVKKTQKTPKADIDLAVKRKKELT